VEESITSSGLGSWRRPEIEVPGKEVARGLLRKGFKGRVEPDNFPSRLLLGPSFSEDNTLLATALSEPFAAPRSTGGYHRVLLQRTDEIEIAAVHWPAGGESSLHGHDDSSGLTCVQSGVIQEERYLPEGEGFRCEMVLLRAGEQTFLPRGAFHRITCLEPSITVHTFSPPPVNPTLPVPAETVPLLQRARLGVRSSERKAWGPAGPIPPCPDLLTLVRDLAPGWAERETEASLAGAVHLPAKTLTEIKNCGVLKAPMPEHLGGWNSSLLQAARSVRLLAREAPSTALALCMALGNAATTRIPVHAVPAPVQTDLLAGQSWIAKQVGQGRILAVANSEPGAGGDLKNTRTLARKDAAGVYRLTGRKAFATFGSAADFFLCAARRQDQDGERAVVDGFFVARQAPGVVLDDCWNPVGLKPTASVGLRLEDSPAEAILGYPGCLEGINSRHWSTVLFAAVFLGVGDRSLREATSQTGAEGIWARGSLAEKALALDAAGGFVEAVAGQEVWPMPPELQDRARRAKTFAARASLEAATHAAMISGGRAYTPDHPVFRCLCDALAGPLLRPPLPQTMDAIVQQMFPSATTR